MGVIKNPGQESGKPDPAREWWVWRYLGFYVKIPPHPQSILLSRAFHLAEGTAQTLRQWLYLHYPSEALREEGHLYQLFSLPWFLIENQGKDAAVFIAAAVRYFNPRAFKLSGYEVSGDVPEICIEFGGIDPQ
jgi:hypothetical protein